MTARVPVTVECLATPTTIERDAILALEAASFSNPWTPDTFDGMVAVPVSRVFVARRDGGDIIAFCACWLIAGELHINTIAVAEPLRRMGIASHLLAHVLAETRAARATLEVRRSNTAALGLYERLGFEVTAIRAQYYENPREDALILWLNP